MTGHWEMMGLHITKPFQDIYRTRISKELIEELEKRTGHKIVGNKSASGTEILDEYGEHEIATGDMIVTPLPILCFRSAETEETFGLDELYRCC